MLQLCRFPTTINPLYYKQAPLHEDLNDKAFKTTVIELTAIKRAAASDHLEFVVHPLPCDAAVLPPEGLRHLGLLRQPEHEHLLEDALLPRRAAALREPHVEAGLHRIERVQLPVQIVEDLRR